MSNDNCLAGKRILIVDEPEMVRPLKEFLEREGAAVDAQYCVQGGIAAIRQANPAYDLIITEIVIAPYEQACATIEQLRQEIMTHEAEMNVYVEMRNDPTGAEKLSYEMKCINAIIYGLLDMEGGIKIIKATQECKIPFKVVVFSTQQHESIINAGVPDNIPIICKPSLFKNILTVIKIVLRIF